jgi:hypothetical protein
MDTFVHPHHHRYARKALSDVRVQTSATPSDWLNDWITLYRTLIERHHITGIAVFSKECFAKQLNVPGIVAFRAVRDEATVGMLLWYVHGDMAYYHLGAYSPRGYESHASFALFWCAIEFFAANGLKWLSLGAGAGIDSDGTEGLTRFKRGWSTGTRIAYLCGRIFDYDKYCEIIRARGISGTNYFPAYRKGEFG